MERPERIYYEGREFQRIAPETHLPKDLRMRDSDFAEEVLKYFLRLHEPYLGGYSDNKSKLNVIVTTEADIQRGLVDRMRECAGQMPERVKDILGYPFRISEVRSQDEYVSGRTAFPEFVLQKGRFLWMKRTDISLKFIRYFIFEQMLRHGDIEAV